MALEFKSRRGAVKVSGNDAKFYSHLNARHRASPSEPPVFSFALANGARQPDKLVFWGTGAEIGKLLNSHSFLVRTEERNVLRMEVTWLPITKRGGKKMAEAALKAALKKSAKVGGKAAFGVLTHGGSLAIDVAETGKDILDAAMKAAKGEIKIEPSNLELDWELRIVINNGPGGDDGVVGWVSRHQNVGQEANSANMAEQFLRLMGAYSVSVKNAMLVLAGEQPYQALLNEDDIEEAMKRAEAKATSTGSMMARKAIEFAKEKLNRPSRDTYQRLDGGDGD